MSYSTETDGRTMEFDHHSKEYRDNTIDTLREIRSRCPVSRTEAHGGFWVATSYDAVKQAARDAETFTSWKAIPPDDRPLLGNTMPPVHPGRREGFAETDGPRWYAERQPLSRYFTPTAVAKLRPEVHQYTTWCIDQFIESGSADLANDLAGPVPALLVMRMLGLPVRDWRKFADIAHKSQYTYAGPEYEDLAGKRIWLRDQLSKAIHERRAKPASDLISVVANLRVDGKLLDFDDALGSCQLLLFGGVDTTSNLLSSSFVHLSAHPESRAWLAEDLTRLPAACEEYLRYFAPVQGISRTVTAPCTLGGQRLAPYDRVWLGWAAANFDPEIFEDPEQIKLDRFPNNHASFGLGPHRCIGSTLARMIWEVVMVEVLRRLGDFAVDTERAERYPSIGVINGWLKVPAAFTPGPRAGAGIEALSV